jgi:hypothetical protein
MNEVPRMLVREGAWQRRRSQLSWPEKIRQAAAARDTLARRSPAEPELKHDASTNALIGRFRR